MSLELFQKDKPAAPPPAPVVIDAPGDQDQEAGRVIACAACRHRLTTTAARIEVDGKHEHACFNPHGYLFRFGCFATAPGAVERGAPSLEWTWFPGFAWRYAHCSACGVHLGWRWQQGDAGFHGLIGKRIVEVDDAAQ